MTRARNIAGFSTITTTPSPIHVGPIGVLTATRIDGEFNVVDIASRDITAQGIGVTNLQVSGITTGLNVSGIITAQNGINFNGTSTGLNVSGIGTIATLNVSGNATIAGVLTYEDVTRVDSVGVVTARGLSIFGNTTGLQVASGISTFQAVTGTTGTFSGDVSIADKIIHTGDTNTAIRFPAADTIALETAGSQRLRVDSSGRLILGGTSAGTYHGDGDDLNIYSASNTGLTIFSGTSSLGSLFFADGNNNVSEQRRGAIQFNHDDDSLAFWTNASERMRITSPGNVGIASAIPRSGFTLDVGGDVTVGIPNGVANTYIDQKQDGDLHLINSGRTSNGVSGNLTGGTGGVGINKFNTRAGGTSLFRDFAVYNGKSTKVLVVDGSSGEVGIGTDDPIGAFEVNWDGTSTDMIMLSRPSTGGNFARLGHNTAGGANMLDVRSEGLMRFLTGGNNERLRLTQDGPHLLLGGTADVNEITESSGHAGMVIGGTSFGNAGLAIITSTSGAGRLYFGDAVGGNSGRNSGGIIYSHSENSLSFRTDDGTAFKAHNGQFEVGNTAGDNGTYTFFNTGSSGSDKGTAGQDGAGDKGMHLRTDMGPTHLDLLGIDNFTLKLTNQAYSGSGISNPQGTITKILFNGVTYNGWNAFAAMGMDVQQVSGGRGDLYFATGYGTNTIREVLRLDSDQTVIAKGVFKQSNSDPAVTANGFYRKVYPASNLGPGSSGTYTTTNGHAAGFVHVFVQRSSNGAVNRGIAYGYHLRTTGQSNLGSSLYDFSGTGGAPSVNITQANQGIQVTNNNSYTIRVYVTFELNGSIDG